MGTFDSLIKRIDQIAEQAEKLSDAFENGDIANKIGNYIIEDLDQIYTNAIDYFYADYDPDYYKDRKHSLYQMYDVKYDDYSIDYNEGPDIGAKFNSAPEHRVSNEYIFDKMWMEGWHGGATPSEKLDYFRRPYPEGFEMAYRKPVKPIKRKKKNGKEGKPIPEYSLWSYRQVAKSDPTIQEKADGEIFAYNNGQNNSSGHTKKERVDQVLKEYNFIK